MAVALAAQIDKKLAHLQMSDTTSCSMLSLAKEMATSSSQHCHDDLPPRRTVICKGQVQGVG